MRLECPNFAAAFVAYLLVRAPPFLSNLLARETFQDPRELVPFSSESVLVALGGKRSPLMRKTCLRVRF